MEQQNIKDTSVFENTSKNKDRAVKQVIVFRKDLLKGDHDQLRQRLNNLKMKIQMIKKQTSEIRKENGVLNMKTLELKKQYNNLIEAEGALMTEKDDLYYFQFY